MKNYRVFDKAAPEKSEGGFVLRKGKIFEVGEYADKEFALSADEMDAACSNYDGHGKLNIEHAPSAFDGLLGSIKRVWHDGRNMFADVLLNRHIDALYQENDIPIKVSTEWDKNTKRLGNMGLVRNPRIADAALMTAFSAIETEAEIEEFAAQDPLKKLHDMSAEHGAECPGKKLFAGPGNSASGDTATFLTPAQLKVVQKVHDLTSDTGTSCDAYATRQQLYGYGFSHNAASTDYFNRLTDAISNRIIDESHAVTESKDNTMFDNFKALFGLGRAPTETELEKAAHDLKTFSPDPTPQGNTSFADSAEFKLLNAQLSALSGELADSRKTAQFAADSNALMTLVRQMKITPANAESFKTLAHENPAAFAAVLPSLQASLPIPAIRVGERTVPMAATGDVSTADSLAKAKMSSDPSLSYHVAFSQVLKEKPELAQALYEQSESTTAGDKN